MVDDLNDEGRSTECRSTRAAIDDARAALAAVEPFGMLDADGLSRLTGAGRIVYLRANELLVDDGEVIDTAFVLVAGHMRRYLTVEQGRRMLLNDTYPVAPFAFSAAYAGTPHLGRIEAAAPSRILALPIAVVDGLLDGNPAFARGMVGMLARSSAHQTQALHELMYTVPVRLARYIMRNATDGVCDPGLSKAGLAEMLGIVPETFSRSLAALVKQGVVVRDGRVIRVVDERGLREYAQM